MAVSPLLSIFTHEMEGSSSSTQALFAKMLFSRVVDLKVGHLHSLLRLLDAIGTIAMPRLTLELELCILRAAHGLDAPEEF